MPNALAPALDSNASFARRTEALLSLALLMILVVLLVPLPTVLLDMLLALNLGITILVLLVTLSARQPLDMSVFPSLLLLLTLFRLSLNVATTRSILLNADAGRIVSTFGGFVVGGELVVGLVIFLILVIIQFVVITKGSNRISEVNARFVLDALPGKQMAIDAELNSGALNEKQAQEKRHNLVREAEFYGAMDGASRFVRGDSIAGLIVTAINLFGGIILGMTNGLPLAASARRYSVLTVGDGLVSQIPALVVATTAGLLVTKASSESSLGEEIGTQFAANPRPLYVGAVILGVISLTPGLPKIPFLLLAAALFVGARRLQANPLAAQAANESSEEHQAAAPDLDNMQAFVHTDRARVEIGASLIPLMSQTRRDPLPARITSLRKDLTRSNGLWVPPVRIIDHMDMELDAYRILIGGRSVAEGRLRPHDLLAIGSGGPVSIDGEDTVDPMFGMPAKWISAGDRGRAEMAGYTVVDAGSVLITHLRDVLRKFAHELLSREDLQKMITEVGRTHPSLIDELKPDVVRMSVVHQVLRLLLEEQAPITSLPQILEAIVHYAAKFKEPEELTEAVRMRIGRDICDRFKGESGQMAVILIDPRLEQRFRESVNANGVALAPGELERLVAQLNQECQKASMHNLEPAVLSDAGLRRPLRKTLVRSMPEIAVVAYPEVPPELKIEPLAVVRWEDVVQEELQTVGAA